MKKLSFRPLLLKVPLLPMKKLSPNRPNQPLQPPLHFLLIVKTIMAKLDQQPNLSTKEMTPEKMEKLVLIVVETVAVVVVVVTVVVVVAVVVMEIVVKIRFSLPIFPGLPMKIDFMKCLVNTELFLELVF